MYEMKDTHILQLDELNGMECRDEGKRSVEQTYDTETGEPTQTSEAQEMLLNLILSLGGIRKEVWEYLLTPRFHDTQAVASVGRLLCYAAPLEWMELSVEALSRMAGTMYVNEITEAYQADMPYFFLPGASPLPQKVHLQKFPDVLPVKHPGQNYDGTAGHRNNCGSDKPGHLLHKQ